MSLTLSWQLRLPWHSPAVASHTTQAMAIRRPITLRPATTMLRPATATLRPATTTLRPDTVTLSPATPTFRRATAATAQDPTTTATTTVFTPHPNAPFPRGSG